MKASTVHGHEVRMWCTHKDAMRNWSGREPDTDFDGYTIRRSRNVIIAGNEMARWKPDVIVSHHDHASFAIRKAKVIGARSVYLTHNQMDLNKSPMDQKPNLIIHNSLWVQESLLRFTQPDEQMVFHPPLTPDRHKVDQTGNMITLVNLNADKGANVFYELARRMPNKQFLGVIGGHGKQVIRHDIPNVTIMDHGPDMRRVWEQTRVLLMPSVYESYGLVAVEAGLNGIPTIANPTPGLVENIGAHGMFAGRDEPELWVEFIEDLDDPETYAVASKYAVERSDAAIESTRDTLKEWVHWIEPVI